MDNNIAVMPREKSKRSFFTMEISDIVFWIMRWKWIVVAVTLVFAALGYTFNVMTYIPQYTAKASMVVNSKLPVSTSNEQAMVASQFNLTQQLMETYTTVLTSDRVGSYVANSLNINMNAENVKNTLEVTAAEDTSVVYISATHKDAYTAKNIANTVMEIAPQLMKDVVEVGNVNILDYAKLPLQPKSNYMIPYVLLSALLGFVISSFFIVLFNFITMKVKNSDDIEYKTGINVFGEIPHASIKNEREKKFIFTGQANSGFAESYFMMGAILRNNSLGKRPYRLIFTSSIAGEGKTTNSLNTTTVLADMGFKVLIIDLDMKKPNISRQLEIDTKDMGGVEAVIKGASLADNVIHTDYGFDFLPCAHSVRHTSKLLSSLRLEMFFKMLDTTEYDYIIIDTAPAHIIADTSVIVKYADGLVLVIKQHFARLRVICDTITGLKKSGANIIGSILNDVRVYNVGSGYAYKYRYGYGYYYYNRDKNSKRGSYLDSYIDNYGDRDNKHTTKGSEHHKHESKHNEEKHTDIGKSARKLENIFKHKKD